MIEVQWSNDENHENNDVIGTHTHATAVNDTDVHQARSTQCAILLSIAARVNLFTYSSAHDTDGKNGERGCVFVCVYCARLSTNLI